MRVSAALLPRPQSWLERHKNEFRLQRAVQKPSLRRQREEQRVYPNLVEVSGMCRNIKTLFNFDPPVTPEEIQNASLQFVRKISGFNKPSKANERTAEESGRRGDKSESSRRGQVRRLSLSGA